MGSRSSFAEEFRNMRSTAGAPKVENAPDVQPEPQVQGEPAVEEIATDPDLALFTIPTNMGEEPEKPAPSEPPTIPAPKNEPEKKIVINGKEFNSVAEAVAYAEFEATEAAKKEAYAKGVIDSTKPKEEPKPVEPSKVKKIADKLFENPEEALLDLENLVNEIADKKIEARESAKETAQATAKQREEAWNDFYKANNDLSQFHDEVQFVVNKNWAAIEKLPVDKGMAKIAELSRAHINSMKEKFLPKQVLNSKQVVTPNGSSVPATATNKQATEKPVSFMSQLSTINKRNANQGGG